MRLPQGGSNEGFTPNQTIGTTRRLRRMPNFQIESCELLRATPAGYPLSFFGAALWQNTQVVCVPSKASSESDDPNHSSDFHAWSRPVRIIRDFWTHSWSDAAWLKIVVLLLEYNGFAAAAIGTAVAFVGSGLFAAGVLPASSMVEGIMDEGEMEYSVWSISMGFVSFVLTLLSWRSDRLVFLDKICISQVNQKKQIDGVYGIGAFLKASECLLVLLDSTYFTRLWCVFEMAAFSKLMDKDAGKTIRFLPLPCGSMFVCLFLIMAVYQFLDNTNLITFSNVNEEHYMAQFLLTSILCTPLHGRTRRYYDALANLKGQLGEFSFDASKCYCCTVGHVHPKTGANLTCDRKAVKSCVNAWFDSVQAFDAFVQHSLYKKFEKAFGRTGIPYRFAVMSFLPVVWGYMDKISARIRHNSWSGAGLYCVFMILDIVILKPLFLACFGLVAYIARRRSRFCCVDACISAGVGISFAAIAIATWFLAYIPAKSRNVFAMAGVWSSAGFLTCGIYCGRRRCRKSRDNETGVPSSEQRRAPANDRADAGVPSSEQYQTLADDRADAGVSSAVQKQTCADDEADSDVLAEGHDQLDELSGGVLAREHDQLEDSLDADSTIYI